MKISTCKGCGAAIVWAKTEEGKNIPLDRRAPVYYVADDGEMVHAAREKLAMVSHFSVCPHANRFSGGKTKPQGDLFS